MKASPAAESEYVFRVLNLIDRIERLGDVIDYADIVKIENLIDRIDRTGSALIKLN